ncbi:MAG: 2Fe-2S iron-sulfur cluster-binding protein [Flammeovirgaceae bacterium]
MVTFYVEDPDGQRTPIAVPTDMNLNLMEVLKGAEYPIQATCGGMALCATCHIEMVEGHEAIGEVTDAELDILDTLPEATDDSRLACQIPIKKNLEGAVIRLATELAY